MNIFNVKIKNFYLLSLLLTLTFFSCKPEPVKETEKDYGVYGIKPSEMNFSDMGGTSELTFITFYDWKIRLEDGIDWFSIDEEFLSGVANVAPEITFTVKANPGDEMREAKIYIQVEGYEETVLTTLKQASDFMPEIPQGYDSNRWISEYMSINYLWNTEYITKMSKINHKQEADAFLLDALESMESNTEDGGVYGNGERYYYSYIETFQYSEAPATRALTGNIGFGVTTLYLVEAPENRYYILVAEVIPESPAARAGLKRGMYINQHNNQYLSTYDQAINLYFTLLDLTETEVVTVSALEYQDVDGKAELVQTLEGTRIAKMEYSVLPIIYNEMLDVAGKKVAYMVYSEFDHNADYMVMEYLQDCKAKGINEMILDLRYNPGGTVVSSLVLATAIVGSEYKGQVFMDMEYNEYRTAKGEKMSFKFGEMPSGEYEFLDQANANPLNLPRLFVITGPKTASASELIITGLEGVDVEVLTVGSTTEGKNVGMEVELSNNGMYNDYDFGSYVYAFAPITFYNVNAKGFKDFSAGLKPDYSVTETSYPIYDWGQPGDKALEAAVYYIENGKWPTPSLTSKSPATVSHNIVEMKSPSTKRGGLLVYPENYFNNK